MSPSSSSLNPASGHKKHTGSTQPETLLSIPPRRPTRRNAVPQPLWVAPFLDTPSPLSLGQRYSSPSPFGEQSYEENTAGLIITVEPPKDTSRIGNKSKKNLPNPDQATAPTLRPRVIPPPVYGSPWSHVPYDRPTQNQEGSQAERQLEEETQGESSKRSGRNLKDHARPRREKGVSNRDGKGGFK